MSQSGDSSRDASGHDMLWSHAARHGKRRLLQAGEILFERGAAARLVYFVIDGRIEVFRNDGAWRVVWSRGAGDMLSFDCADRRELESRAVTPCELIGLERDKLQRLARQEPIAAEALQKLHADELQIMLATLGDRSRMTRADALGIASTRERVDEQGVEKPRFEAAGKRRPSKRRRIGAAHSAADEGHDEMSGVAARS